MSHFSLLSVKLHTLMNAIGAGKFFVVIEWDMEKKRCATLGVVYLNSKDAYKTCFEINMDLSPPFMNGVREYNSD